METPVASGVYRLDRLIVGEGVAKRARILDELRHPTPAIELLQHPDDRLALGPGLREAHGIPELVFGNINRRLHASIF